MISEQRNVGGFWCADVLGNLSAYLDGELAAETVEQINAHIRECDWCELFGGEFRAIVTELRTQLAEPEPLPDEAKQRLWKYLGSPEDRA